MIAGVQPPSAGEPQAVFSLLGRPWLCAIWMRAQRAICCLAKSARHSHGAPRSLVAREASSGWQTKNKTARACDAGRRCTDWDWPRGGYSTWPLRQTPGPGTTFCRADAIL